MANPAEILGLGKSELVHVLEAVAPRVSRDAVQERNTVAHPRRRLDWLLEDNLEALERLPARDRADHLLVHLAITRCAELSGEDVSEHRERVEVMRIKLGL